MQASQRGSSDARPEEATGIDSSPRLSVTPASAGSVSDAELLSSVAGGDEAAFSALYERYAGRVNGLIRRLVKEAALADEILQDVFLEIWRTAARYDASISAPETWIFSVARYRAIDGLRRRARQQVRESKVSPGMQPAGPDSHPGGEWIRNALGRLPEDQRSTICLSFYYGLTYRRIAELEQVPEGTIKTRMRLAMSKLRDLVQDRWEVAT